MHGVNSMKKNKKPAPSQYAPRQKIEEFPRFARPGSVAKKKIDPVINSTYIREDGLAFKSLPSIRTTGDSTAKKAELKYTGENLLGISIVHKSSLQPVFNHDQAKDLASMRR
jgi:hypothetical protein